MTKDNNSGVVCREKNNSHLKLDTLNHSQRAAFARSLFGRIHFAPFMAATIVEVR